MKKTKLNILFFFYFLFVVIEFTWSIVVKVFEAIGEKLNELTDTTESVIEKLKA
jgi:hypothetical protein